MQRNCCFLCLGTIPLAIHRAMSLLRGMRLVANTSAIVVAQWHKKGRRLCTVGGKLPWQESRNAAIERGPKYRALAIGQI